MSTSSFSLFGLLSLFMSGGLMSGAGLPLGLPPVENDPIIAHVAPADSLVYVGWNKMATPSADSSNYTEQLLADAEIRRFVKEVSSRVLESIRKNAGGGEQTKLVANELPKLLYALAVNPTAIYVSPPTPLPSIGIVCRVGRDQSAALEASLQKIESVVADESGQIVERNGMRIHRWPVAPATPPLEWGVVDDCFVIAFGPGEFQKIVDRKKAAKTPDWLTRIHKRLPVERVANVVHIDTKAILTNAAPILQTVPPAISVIEELGLNDVQSITCVTGLDKTGCVARTWVNTTGQPKGLLKLVKVRPLDVDDLNVIPADARVAMAFRMDPAMVFQQILNIADGVEPGSSRDIKEELQFMESAFGMNLEKDVLESVGDSWRIYQSEAEGGSLFTGWTAVISVRDATKLRDVMNVVKGFVAAQNAQMRQGGGMRRPHEVRLQSFKRGSNEIFFLNFIGETSPIAPAWCVTDDQLVFSVFPQGVTAYLNRKASTPRITQLPEIKDRFQSKPVAMMHYDTAEIFNTVYPLLQIGANFMFSELQREGIDVDISVLPTAPAVSRYLKPGSVTVNSVDDGFEIVNRRTLPVGIETLGLVMPSMLFGTRPMGFSSRRSSTIADVLSPTRARMTQSKNNMKQLGLAFHNFHDVHRKFPAAVTKDKSGKPGLSWRVQLLPFLDQAPLFDQFHLDEPWDSEHNKKLIALMPPVFKAPGSKATGFKTNYVGLRVKGSILAPDEDGTSMRQVRDGTSNTILLVEADDKHAVIWTKPDDLDFDPKKPHAGLASASVKSGFLAALTDGSVRLISSAINADTLNNLVTRDDGNPIGEF